MSTANPMHETWKHSHTLVHPDGRCIELMLVGPEFPGGLRFGYTEDEWARCEHNAYQVDADNVWWHLDPLIVGRVEPFAGAVYPVTPVSPAPPAPVTFTDDDLVTALRNHPDPLRIIQAAKIAGPWIEDGRHSMRETFGAWGWYDRLAARIGPEAHAWVDMDEHMDSMAPMRALDPGTGKAEADAALLAAGWRLLDR